MKVLRFAFLLAAASPAVAAKIKVSQDLSPVSRVVELLQGLMKTAEEEGKKEESLFEKFMCWGKTIVDTKTKTNAAAESRIQELEAYIADIDAGRIEFTSERVDLEKDLAEVNAAIEQATAMRNKEREEFLDAEEEMLKAVTALDSAITVLKEATAAHQQGVLFAQSKAAVSEGYAQRAEEVEALDRAVELGQRVLTKGDARFLRRLLTGDVPDVDWNKLNRKATFKQGYKARSFKIQDVLAKLNQTFTMNLADARAKESEAADTYQTLMTAKNQEKTATETSLAQMSAENGARSMTKEESQAEVDALRTQVTNDNTFIQQTKTTMAEKTDEWKDRSELRAKEIEAMSKAIAILSNDDAKDLFKRSHTSQGYALLQTGMNTTARAKSVMERAASELKRAMARTSGRSDRRLAAIAALVRAGNGTAFSEVLGAIDQMVATLQAEEASDLAAKEQCETDMAADTRTVSLKSRGMDELTDAMTKLQQEIEAIVAEIEEKQATIKETEEQLAEATVQRQDEHKAWMAADADDKEASATVTRAKGVLQQFYTDNNLMLAQQTPVVVAGQAPPPPPSTWESPYMGKTEESTSIISILQMIIEDIDKDTAKAEAAENKAQVEFDTFEQESQNQIAELNSDISDLNATKGNKEEEIAQKTTEHSGLNSELDTVMQKIADAKPHCDFIAVNFAGRLQNRQIEIDGLLKAKAILTGAVFPNGPDPNRELKPGDALIQRHLRR